MDTRQPCSVKMRGTRIDSASCTKCGVRFWILELIQQAVQNAGTRSRPGHEPARTFTRQSRAGSSLNYRSLELSHSKYQ